MACAFVVPTQGGRKAKMLGLNEQSDAQVREPAQGEVSYRADLHLLQFDIGSFLSAMSLCIDRQGKEQQIQLLPSWFLKVTEMS